MTVNKRPIRLGELLVQLGRITPDDVARALEEQRAGGGFLGDALIRLGLITRDELTWTLADQHDIPFVRLRPEHIDHGLAALVPAAWAREHNILPVLQDGDRVTAVIADVTHLELLDEVCRLTGAASAEPALAAPETIRELIDAVYGPAVQPAGSLLQLLTDALAYGAGSLGISVRGASAIGWYRVVETVHRPLLAGWQGELACALSPLAPTTGGGEVHAWPATLTVDGAAWRVACHAAGHDGTMEWAARLVGPLPRELASVEADSAAVDAVRRAMANGPVLVGVRADGAPGLDEALSMSLPALPALLLGTQTRSIHLSDRSAVVPGGTLALPVDGPLDAVAEQLAIFSPQALTVDVDHLAPGDEAALRNAAPFSAVLVRGADATPPSFDLTLRLAAGADGFTWSPSEQAHAQD
ncbi:hypothetical protein [Longimicrobium sp.]|uniref:GspE/PulE/PilB domain-containing protein n=1 Tax=Longimicrobium sp. TaxID=2029185 RepID=UPI002F924205